MTDVSQTFIHEMKLVADGWWLEAKNCEILLNAARWRCPYGLSETRSKFRL
jgi:hypothetical protein